MPKWEYTIVYWDKSAYYEAQSRRKVTDRAEPSPYASTQAMLSAMGEAGWELALLEQNEIVFYFKRPKP